MQQRRTETPKSRLAKLKDDGHEPQLPEVACQYLIEILLEVGPVNSSGLGHSVLTQADIGWWQHNTSIRLQPWETRLLRRLSDAWLQQARVAESPSCPAPYSVISVSTRQQVADQIDALFPRPQR